jgi:hypothetical protein
MGKQNPVDKTIRPLSTITNITPISTVGNLNSSGVLPIGVYKGTPAFWDLDKAVNQPLVAAEIAHILGILDGRKEGYDLKTLTTVVGATSPIGTKLTGTLVVPAGLVFFLTGVKTVVDASAAKNGLTANWKCSLWPDNAVVASALGQSFWAIDLVQAAGDPATTTFDEFGPLALAWKETNKHPVLRVPAGASISFCLETTDDEVDVAAASTLQLYGTVGKLLVA